MSNWIDSGGDEPRLYSAHPTNCKSEQRRIGNAIRPGNLTRLGSALALIALAASAGHARDRGLFANTNPDVKAWFDSLRSGKGPCCSDGDGSALSDSDWDSKDGHYRVRVPRYGYALDGQQRISSGSTCPKRP